MWLEGCVSDAARQHPGACVEVWGEDEARAGLLPTTRRTWSPCWRRPVACTRRRYQWNYVWGFVHPRSGRTEWLITTTVSGAGTSAALKAFADEVGAGTDRRIVLVVDGAGWHSAAEVAVPEGIHLVVQPPYSPELQPAGRLWRLGRETFASRDVIDEHRDVTARRIRELAAQPDAARASTLMHRWPQEQFPKAAEFEADRAVS